MAVLTISLIAFIGAGCTRADRSAESFCESLKSATSAGGAEVAFLPGDSARIDGVIEELNDLLERAPDRIATSVSTLVDFFESYQKAPRQERRELLASELGALSAATEQLDEFAFDECGVLLQRAAPTPFVPEDPGIEVAPE